MADAAQHRMTPERFRVALGRIRQLVRAKWSPGAREQSITSNDLAQTVARRLLERYASVLESDADPDELEDLANTILKNYLNDRLRREHGRDGKGGHQKASLDEAAIDAAQVSPPGTETSVLARRALEEMRRFARGDGPVAAAIPDANRRKRLVRMLFLYEVKDLSARDIGQLVGLSKNRVNEELQFARALFSSCFSSEEETP